jgi:ABC-2 type transport system permease protein
MTSMTGDLSEPIPANGGASLKGRAERFWRLVRVLTAMDIKIRYGDSVLGYVWTIGKPMALFSILYVVFGMLVRFASVPPHYALSLVIGVMLWSFFADGVTRTMSSLVANGNLMRKLPFPRLVIPLAASLTAFLTFGLGLLAIVIFIGFNGLVPRLDWLVIVLELLELYLFVLGVGLVLGVLYVRLRDVAQVWELVMQLLFFLAPIVYPFSQVHSNLGERIMLLNPFTQIMQDIRSLIIYDDHSMIVAPLAFSPTRVIPLVIVALTLGLGFYLFKREDPWFPERV